MANSSIGLFLHLSKLVVHHSAALHERTNHAKSSNCLLKRGNNIYKKTTTLLNLRGILRGFVSYNEHNVKCARRSLYITVHMGCVRLGNLGLDLKIWIFGKRISRRILLIEILTRHGFCDKIRCQILCSIGNPKIQILRSKSRFPNRTHPYIMIL